MSQFFEQKSGDPDRFDGRMTAYAIVEGTETIPSELRQSLHKGSNIFAAQADCRQQQSMDDFLKTEMGSSLKKGLDQVMQRLREAGLWNESNDPTAPKEESELVQGMAELIPIMARIVNYEEEEEALQQEGDVYFLGKFSDFRAANMCVQAFSLLYQFRYREQERSQARRSVEDLLAQIEQQIPSNENFRDCKESLEKKLFGSYVPAILYSKQNKEDHQRAVERFKKFMEGYRFPEDIAGIVNLSYSMNVDRPLDVKKLELLLHKIIALSHEDFDKLASIQRELNGLQA